ncbi:hypothetical protein [Vibrio sp. PID17_43]|uniref:hypothetical protein n=1 Tax=Vibrio sp. PID17_43 TaxID=1583451 RepID=UPI000BFF93FC|nr:hypothetical protein [Vibrio sp. PID17_43]PHJ43573.1 hypothetical protein AK965_01140 [Vibrio sp. PID17_43]
MSDKNVLSDKRIAGIIDYCISDIKGIFSYYDGYSSTDIIMRWMFRLTIALCALGALALGFKLYVIGLIVSPVIYAALVTLYKISAEIVVLTTMMCWTLIVRPIFSILISRIER